MQTVERALSVLHCFSSQEPELTASELSQRLGLPRPTVYRLLGTMETLGFICHDPGSRRYRPGLDLVTLASVALNQMHIRCQSLPEVHALANQLRLGANLAILYQDEVFYLESVPHPSNVTMFSLVGRRNPTYATALGKVLLAALPAAQAEGMLRRRELVAYTPHTLTDVRAILTDLHLTRQRGYALDNEEWVIHNRCIAAPILDRTARVVAALSISGPDTEIRQDNLESLVRDLKDAAGRASYRLGYVHTHR